jgi:hypothetical protein
VRGREAPALTRPNRSAISLRQDDSCSFVIKQIENAVGYFKNPTISPAQRNWLDDQTTLYL